MFEESIERELEQHPHLRRLLGSVLFITKETEQFYKSDDKFDIGDKEISVTLLKDLLAKDQYYEYVKKLCDGSITAFSTKFIIFGDAVGGNHFHRADIIKGLTLLEASGYEFSEVELERYQEVKSACSFDKFAEKNKDEGYYIEVDDKKYIVPVLDVIDFIKMPDAEFEQLCNTEYGHIVNGMPKEHMAYIACECLKDSNLFRDYLVPEEIEKRYDELSKSEKIDTEALNRLACSGDSNLGRVALNEELKSAILNGMPEDVSDLEKAMYIYIKMCKLLTYDDEYFAVNQRGPATLKHKDVGYISTITPDHNEAVCFEFNLIYAKLIDEIGIPFASEYQSFVGDFYGEGHVNLQFRCNKFLVKADSVTSILNGDLVRAKLNQPLLGLTCMNQNETTKMEFSECLTKMYELVAKQFPTVDSKVEHVETFEEILSQYMELSSPQPKIDLDEKLDILIEKVNSTPIEGVDSLAYVLKLRNILFTKDEKEKNISVTILRNNDTNVEGKSAMGSVIFVLNKDGFEEHPDRNQYYFYNPNTRLVPVTKEFVQEKFDDDVFSYVQREDPKIPGIDEVGGFKK